MRSIKRQLGYSIITDPAGPTQEADTFTCGHCGAVVWTKPFKDGAAMGGRCTCCDSLICLRCVGKGCSPLKKKLEQWERRRQLEELNR
jgi:hypothetical protein